MNTMNEFRRISSTRSFRGYGTSSSFLSLGISGNVMRHWMKDTNPMESVKVVCLFKHYNNKQRICNI